MRTHMSLLGICTVVFAKMRLGGDAGQDGISCTVCGWSLQQSFLWSGLCLLGKSCGHMDSAWLRMPHREGNSLRLLPKAAT